MDIKEFRQKFPQYDDMSDQELANALYKKHYSDMDRAEFNAAFLGSERSGQGGEAPSLTEGEPVGRSSHVVAPYHPDMAPGEGAIATLKNLPGSGVQLVKNIAHPFLHPIETKDGVVDLAKGVYHKFTPGEQPEEAAVDAVKDFFVQRYGGLENIQRTAVEDPVGFLSDIALLFTGGGAALKGAGAVGKSSTLARAGQSLSKVGRSIEPVNVATAAAGKLIPKKLPQKMYASATKMTTSKKVSPQQRLATAQAGLDEAILPTQSGLAKLGQEIDTVNSKIAALIDDVAKEGDVIYRSKVLKSLDDLKQDAYFSSDRKKYFGLIRRMENKIKTDYGPRIPANAAQKLKQNIYKEVRKFYGGRASFTTEMKKALARGVKDELAQKYPELAELNARDSALLELEKAIEASVKRIENRDLVGIGIPIKVGAGATAGAAAGVEGAVAGGLAGLVSGVADTPIVKAKLAIALNKLKKSGLSRSPGAYAGRETARQVGRLDEALATSR